jgi:hypothetical protein
VAGDRWLEEIGMAGVKGRSGRKKGMPHTNGTHSGDIVRLPLGEMPATMRRQLQTARQYRRDLEQLTVDAKGCIDALDAHLINEAVTAECHAAVCRWLLRTKLDKMAALDIAKCSGEILRGRTVRNRAVERLGLDREAEDAIVALYSREVTTEQANGYSQLNEAAPSPNPGLGQPEPLPANDRRATGSNSATNGSTEQVG